jgi:hypothetical protein
MAETAERQMKQVAGVRRFIIDRCCRECLSDFGAVWAPNFDFTYLISSYYYNRCEIAGVHIKHGVYKKLYGISLQSGAL